MSELSDNELVLNIAQADESAMAAIYDRYGLTTDRSVMAHSIHTTHSELERMAAAGTAVAHCPGSNAALGSGIFPLARHIEAGVTCALGTDVGGGIGFGMMKEGLHAYLMQRLAPVPLGRLTVPGVVKLAVQLRTRLIREDVQRKVPRARAA